jgi:hypothetical protein
MCLKYNHLDIIYYLLSLDYNKCSHIILYEACKYNNIQVVRKLLANNICYDSKLLSNIAARGGCNEVIQMLDMKGELDWTAMFDGACLSGRESMIEYIIENHGDIELSDNSAINAGRGGNEKFINIVKLSNMSNTYVIVGVLVGLIIGNKYEMLEKYIVEIKTILMPPIESVNKWLKWSVGNNYYEIVKLLVKHFPVDTNIILTRATYSGYIKMMKYALSLGANSYKIAIVNILHYKNYHCIQVLLDNSDIKLSNYFDYKNKPSDVLNILKYGLDITHFEGMPGYDELIESKKFCTLNLQKILNHILQNELVSIIDSYLLLNYN